MSQYSIDVKKVSKCFKLYENPKDHLKEIFHPFKKKYHREFWALKNINFRVFPGETWGIVGRNGSGKSTLLQIICGVLQPTTGSVQTNGKISALLELGVGFNPEFTGRDNVYVKGAVQGFSKDEIDAKFDEIIAFADIGDFLEQPVKTYSSGMMVRLAFSVAINVEPNILIVDEALAVGDEAFQRKCFRKIDDLKKKGVTILYVTHSAQSVMELCDHAILLDQSESLLIGTPKQVITRYQQLLYANEEAAQKIRNEIKLAKESQPIDLIIEESNSLEFFDPNLKTNSPIYYSEKNEYGVEIKNVAITNLDGKKVNHLIHGRDYVYSYTVHFYKGYHFVWFGMLFKTLAGYELGGGSTSKPHDAISFVNPNSKVNVMFKFNCLMNPGSYFTNAGVTAILNNDIVYLERIIDVYMFKVQHDEKNISTGVVDFNMRPDYQCFEGS